MVCSLRRLQGGGGCWCRRFDILQNYWLMCVCWTGRWDQSLLKSARTEAWPWVRELQTVLPFLSPTAQLLPLSLSKGSCYFKEGRAWLSPVSAKQTFIFTVVAQSQLGKGTLKNYNSFLRWSSQYHLYSVPALGPAVECNFNISPCLIFITASFIPSAHFYRISPWTLYSGYI